MPANIGMNASSLILFGGREFSPRDIPGIAYWLDAGKISGLSDGDPVALWEDQSGKGIDVTQDTGSKKPEYKTSILNGRPIVRFDGADVLASASVAGPVLFGPNSVNTLYIVLKQLASSAQNEPISFQGGAGRVMMNLTYDDVIYADWYASPSGRVSVGQPVGWDDAWHLFESRVDVGKTRYIDVDGVELVNGAGTAMIDAGSDNLFIGAIDGSAAAGLGGDMAELLLYDTCLSAVDRKRVEDYFAAKYGLTIA